jgi:uncharacterized protein (DUF2267 family)
MPIADRPKFARQPATAASPRKLIVEETLEFAKALPPLLRAVFVEDWHLALDRPAFAARAV